MWFTSDLHFFHRNVIKYDNRPFEDVAEMNAELIKRWNAKVKPGAVIYVLGDFSFGNREATRGIIERLNGQKIIVRGNHDPSARKLIELGFHDVLENEPLKITKDIKVLLSHFPYASSGDSRYPHKRIITSPNAFLLHGHVHTAWHTKDRMINVGCMHYDYAPVHLTEIVKLIENQLAKEALSQAGVLERL